MSNNWVRIAMIALVGALCWKWDSGAPLFLLLLL